ncbi:hypothetical protein [Radiobacillus sp. PE A8.2]|uniref:hypothetical protein n=1 Tax=Radiobacillus sp. PE A8.2 TaxID=3380349 RepID=UPI00388DA819
MHDFEFYLEFEGGKTYNQNYVEMVKDYSAKEAATKFANKQGLKFIKIESVISDEENYRAYFLERKFFKKDREHIYLVKKRVISISI